MYLFPADRIKKIVSVGNFSIDLLLFNHNTLRGAFLRRDMMTLYPGYQVFTVISPSVIL